MHPAARSRSMSAPAASTGSTTKSTCSRRDSLPAEPTAYAECARRPLAGASPRQYRGPDAAGRHHANSSCPSSTSMRIEYDPAKREETLRLRGLDMARAGEIFTGATKTAEDRRRMYGEARYITIGYLDERMVILAGTRRSRRVIRMRKANEREQARYAPDIRR